MNVKDITIDKNQIIKASKKIAGNDVIAGYYGRLNKETENETYLNRAKSVKGCFKLWDIDYYRLQKTKDVKHINLCKDKFCLNCQTMASQKRQAKYTPVLDRLQKDFDIYHIVFTVPNCNGDSLDLTINKMYSKFPYITQYLQGKRKSNSVNFVQFGFVGAIRSLEITIKKTACELEYHPHLHCLFMLRKGIDNKKNTINDYSFNGKKSKARKFSDFEILLQKCWRIFFNGGKLTATALNELKQGYSVTADKVKPGEYHEVFKYAVKGSFKDGTIYNYEIFKILYSALHRRKIIQGYGALNKYDFEEDYTDIEIENIYKQILLKLSQFEEPMRCYSKLNEIRKELEENSDITYISKNRIRKALKDDDV